MQTFQLYSAIQSAPKDTPIPLLLHLQIREKKGDVIPKDVSLMLDVSGSMVGVTKELRALASTVAHDLVKVPGSRLEIVTFASSVNVLFPEEEVPHDSEGKEAFLKKALGVISDINPSGATNTYAAVSHVLSGVREKRIVIFVTDGDPTCGETKNAREISQHACEFFQNKPGVGGGGWQLLMIGLGFNLKDEDTASVGQSMLPGSLYKVVRTVDEIPHHLGLFFGDPVFSFSKVDCQVSGSMNPVFVSAPKLPVLKYGQDLYFALDATSPGDAFCELQLSDAKVYKTQIKVEESAEVVFNTEGDVDWKWTHLKVQSLMDKYRDMPEEKIIKQANNLLDRFNTVEADLLKKHVQRMENSASQRDRYFGTQEMCLLLQPSSGPARQVSDNYMQNYHSLRRDSYYSPEGHGLGSIPAPPPSPENLPAVAPPSFHPVTSFLPNLLFFSFVYPYVCVCVREKFCFHQATRRLQDYSNASMSTRFVFF
jgi:hypothetical protein